MYETVKTVNGHAIRKMKGTRGCYEVTICEGKGFREYQIFKTIKAATDFIKSELQSRSQ